MERYTVGEVAEIAGVTVRTLHHYDESGLLRPSDRTESGYRLYEQADLERLQEILFLRALGLGLAEIADHLRSPAGDRASALRRHRSLLEARASELGAMLRLLDDTLRAHEEGRTMKAKELFDGFDPEEHTAEAEERWGDTEAWKQSARRTKDYGEAQWRAIKGELAEIEERIGALFGAGEAATTEAAMDAVEAHRLHIERWFYDCPRQMQVGLGEMYVSDPRFTAHYDEPYGDGCAAWVRDAILANAARN